MKLGIFITTHLNKGYRHGSKMESELFDFFCDKTIKSHIDYKVGIDNTIYICDTGSTDERYLNWVNNTLPSNIVKIDIPNHDGAWAAMKYIMHDNKSIINNFDYMLFQVDDDGCFPQKDNWATDLIEYYNKDTKTGIMGRLLDSIKLGKNGLVDHRNCAPQIAKIWGIKEDTIIPHLHGNWYFMSSKILKLLSNIWYEPFYSVEDMNYQKKYENEDFCTLAKFPDRRKTLDNVHIGREIDLPLRIDKLGFQCTSYKGISVYPNAIQPYSHWKNPKVPVKGFYGEYIYENK